MADCDISDVDVVGESGYNSGGWCDGANSVVLQSVWIVYGYQNG